jgi:hypothetical protein
MSVPCEVAVTTALAGVAGGFVAIGINLWDILRRRRKVETLELERRLLLEFLAGQGWTVHPTPPGRALRVTRSVPHLVDAEDRTH